MKRRMEKIGATTALTGGILVGVLGCASEATEAKPVPAPHPTSTDGGVFRPGPVTEQDPTNSLETVPDSPKNRARKCIFATGQAAILDVLRTDGVTASYINSDLVAYKGSPNISKLSVDLSNSGQAIVDYDLSVGIGEYSTRGLITIPLNGSIQESLASANPQLLHEDYEIEDRSAVFNLQDGTGSTVRQAASFDQAEITCDVAEDITDALSK